MVKQFTDVIRAKWSISKIERVIKLSSLDTLSKRVRAWNRNLNYENEANIELIFDTWTRYPAFFDDWYKAIYNVPNGKLTLIFSMPIAASCAPDMFLKYFPSDPVYHLHHDAPLWIELLKKREHREQMYAHIPEQPARWYDKHSTQILHLKNASLPAMLCAYFSKNSVTHPLLTLEHSELLGSIKSVQMLYPHKSKKNILQEAKKLLRMNNKYPNQNGLDIAEVLDHEP